MTTLYRTTSLTKSINDFGQQFCDQVYTATLAQSTDTTFTIPGGGVMGGITAPTTNKSLAVIRVKNAEDVWIALGATAAVPVGASFALSSSELVSGGQDIAKYVNVGDVLHFFTAAANVTVSVAVYAIDGY